MPEASGKQEQDSVAEHAEGGVIGIPVATYPRIVVFDM